MERTVTHKSPVFSNTFSSPKIIFLYGPSSSGKKTQAERLSSEQGCLHISMKALMQAEIKRGSEEGQQLEKMLKAGHIPSKDIRVSLLSREISINPNHSYIISGFLKSLDEALEFEKRVAEIKLIVNFVINDKQAYFEQLQGRNRNIEQIEQHLNQKHEIIEFYKQFGAVKETDAIGTPEVSFKKFKLAIRPEVFFIIGAPGCGKTTIGSKMAEKYNLHFIDLETIVWDKDVSGRPVRLTDDNSISSRVMQAMERTSAMRFLIEGFPTTLYNLKQFELAYTKPKKIFYIALYKEELMQRSTNPNINVEYLNYMKKMSPVIDALEKKPNFAKINANLSVENSMKQISSHMEPEVVIVRKDPDGSFSNYLHGLGFTDVNLQESMTLICKRQTPKGKNIMHYIENGKIVPKKMLVSLIQDSLYNGSSFGKKFIIKGKFPSSVKELKYFEKDCAKISKIYHIINNPSDFSMPELDKEEIDTFLAKDNRLSKIYYNSSLSEEERLKYFEHDLQERINRKKGKWIVVLGQYLTGKSTISKYLADHHKFKLINYEELPEQIKTKKSTEEEPYENVTWHDIIEELVFQASKPNAIILLDGFPPDTMVLEPEEKNEDPETSEGEIEKDKNVEYFNKIKDEFIAAMGTPYAVLHTVTDLAILEKRLFVSLELGEEDELTEEHHELFKDSAAKENPFLWWLDSLKCNYSDELDPDSWKTKIYYQIDTGKTISKTKEYLNSIFSKKFIIVDGDSHKHYENYIENLCINYDIFHVNMESVIAEEINTLSERGNLIFTMRSQHIQLPLSLKFALIQDYLNKYLPYRSQLILLSHFSSTEDPYEYPRGMDTFLALEEKLGEIISVIRICNRKSAQNVEIEYIPVVHYPPPKPANGEEEEVEEKKSDEENEENHDNSQIVKNEPVELPPRSEPREPVGLSKLFQLYKRNMPYYESFEELQCLEECFKKIIEYMRNEGYISPQDSIRLRCPNLQVLA